MLTFLPYDNINLSFLKNKIFDKEDLVIEIIMKIMDLSKDIDNNLVECLIALLNLKYFILYSNEFFELLVRFKES